MSFVRPTGKFRWNASLAPDVVQYNIYGKQADADPPSDTQLTLADLKFTIPAVPGQAEYEVNLADIPGLVGANGETYVFAVASQDAAGNISDFSQLAVFPLDATAPDAPGNFTFVAE